MREILFRGKRIGNGEWVYGNYAHTDCYPKCNDYIGQNVIDRPIIPKTLGQYTGLIDKNGKKVFEGDIIRNTDDNNIAVVSWYEEHAAFMLYIKKQNKIYFLYDNNFKLIEVIGNIHDNPELLKEHD